MSHFDLWKCWQNDQGCYTCVIHQQFPLFLHKLRQFCLLFHLWTSFTRDSQLLWLLFHANHFSWLLLICSTVLGQWEFWIWQELSQLQPSICSHEFVKICLTFCDLRYWSSLSSPQRSYWEHLFPHEQLGKSIFHWNQGPSVAWKYESKGGRQ